MKSIIKYILRFKNSFACKLNGHLLIPAGSCPFTGHSYQVCTRCNSLIKDNHEKTY